MRRTTNLLILFTFLAYGLIVMSSPAYSAGASIYLSPARIECTVDANCSVGVKVNSDGQSINAAEGTIKFDPGKLQALPALKGGSIFSFWAPDPVVDNAKGTVVFGGGLPQPGFNGSSGLLITLVFKPKVAGEAKLAFTGGAVLANDGQGSNILTALGSATISIKPKSLPVAENPEPAPLKTESADEKAEQTAKQQEEKGDPAVKPAQSSLPLVSDSPVSSRTHPDQNSWYSSTTFSISWDASDIEGVSFILDKDINTIAPEKINSQDSGKSYEKLADGIWYFHLRLKKKSGWSAPFTYKAMIDSTPPRDLESYIRKDDPENWPLLFFKAIDGLSGIDRYEIKIGSLEEKGYVSTPEQDSIKAEDLSAGEHTAIIKAIDKAGNEVIKEVHFTIDPLDPAKIEYFPQEIKSSDKIFFSGKAVKGGEVNIYLENENGKVVLRNARADESGNWSYLHDETLPNGRYFAWVEALNKNGLKSDPSAKVSFIVSPPVMARIGNTIISYFTVISSLLFMLLLIIGGTALLIYFIRKKLRKETYEIETAVNEKIGELKKEIENDFKEIAREESPVQKQRRIIARRKLDDKVESARKRIIKEVKDVEDILK